MEYFISIAAVIISCLSLIISLRESYLNGRPFISMVDAKFIPKEFSCYSSDLVDGYKQLTEENKRLIERTKQSVSLQSIGEKPYLLFNLLREDSDLTGVRLVTAPMICTYTNTGGIVNEIEFVKAITTFKDEDKGRKYKVKGKITPKVGKKIIVNIAYVCREGQATSILFEKLINEQKEFSYLSNKSKAKDIINFKKEEFIFTCKNHKKKKYRMRIIVTMDFDTGVEVKII